MTALARALRLFHTVRYLRPAQVWGRAAHVVRKVRPRAGPAPAVRAPASAWRLPEWRAPSMLGPDRFRFLNQERRLAAASDWNNPAWPRLWLYNLHYFDDLDARGAEGRQGWHEALIARWIAENPPPAGPGWEPYCLSLRIVNWCRFAWRGRPLGEAATRCLAVQVRALADQLEIHLLGNHLWANAKALVFAGLFFEGDEADGWLRLGLRHLRRELAEQVLPDGGHFELSPMYHAIVAADVLEVLAADRVAPGRLPRAFVTELKAAAARMLAWAEAMSHPDGEVSFFNDSAMGIGPPLAALRSQAAQLGLITAEPLADPMVALEASGYVRAQAGPAVLFVDVGVVGPRYLPAHAHADTLSFELSMHGERVVVNSGVSTYASGRDRTYERGTAAHNAVEVDGVDSSEVWAAFRVARRARPFDVSVYRGTPLTIKGRHDGYRRLRPPVTHSREWRLDDTNLMISDHLSRADAAGVAYLHLHPDVQARFLTVSEVVLCRRTGACLKLGVEGGRLRLADGHWRPEFGLRIPNKRLEIAFEGSLTTHLRWD